MNWRCPCCGYYTFLERPGKTFDICPVCCWEDDMKYSDENLSEVSGANSVSLYEARENYKEWGACDIDLIESVREPNEDELDGNDWDYPAFS